MLTQEQQSLSEVVSDTITRFNDRKADGCGCTPFASPEDWRKRGELYGLDSVLIVIHDGGDYAKFFNSNYCCFNAIDAMNKALSDVGYWFEECTSWYSAIYKKPDNGEQ